MLTDYLEQTFSKDELMELYLNVIEFGPAVYGITAAAEHYFGRTPAELNLAECLFLSSLLPAPLRYGAMRESGEVPEGWMRTLRYLDADRAQARAHLPTPSWPRARRSRRLLARRASARRRVRPCEPRSRLDGDDRRREHGVAARREPSTARRRLLRYRARSAAKKRAQSRRRTRSASTPATTSKRWFSRASRPIANIVVTAPAFGSAQP